MSVRVELSPLAAEQVEEIQRWWRESRSASPTHFIDELANAIRLLHEQPAIGTRFPHPRFEELRRLVLPRTDYVLFYVVDRSAVRILAVWSTKRERSSPLTE